MDIPAIVECSQGLVFLIWAKFAATASAQVQYTEGMEPNTVGVSATEQNGFLFPYLPLLTQADSPRFFYLQVNLNKYKNENHYSIDPVGFFVDPIWI